MKNAIILMTALLPTTGHSDLINFAKMLPDTKVHVLVNDRTFEPIPGTLRVKALKEEVFDSFTNNVVIKNSTNDHAPQNPSDMINGFWRWWKEEINRNFPEVIHWDYVVASEPYGINVAHSLNAEFIPYDISRSHNKTKGSIVRDDIWKEWNSVLPVIRRNFLYKAVLFGQESVGKTTISSEISKSMNIPWVVEYARPYLEEVGEDLSMQKMSNIHAGQKALQEILSYKATHPALVFDTDLFSTIGYYRIMKQSAPPELIKDALNFKADMYYILPDNIPLVKDPLRYGGEKRESSQSFWIELLEEFSQKYIIVPEGSIEEKKEWISQNIILRFKEKTENIRNFLRD